MHFLKVIFWRFYLVAVLKEKMSKNYDNEKENNSKINKDVNSQSSYQFLDELIILKILYKKLGQ